MAVLLLIGVPLWLIGSSDTAPPAIEPSPTTAAPSPSTEAPPVVAPADMLEVGDLPQRFEWQVYDETQHDDGEIGAWTAGWHGLLPIRCTEEIPTVAAWSPDGEIWVGWLDLEDPALSGLGEVQHRALYAVANTQIVYRGTTHVVGEVVFAESPAAEARAFDALEAEIIACVDDQDRWAEATALGYEVGRLPITPLGDDYAAGKWKVPFPGFIDLFRVAIVRQGPQLLLVESHESYSGSLVVPLTDSEFADIVEAAVNRLGETTAEARTAGG